MDDFERYGDYNEIDDEPPKRRNFVTLIIKLAAALVIIAVVGVVGVRMFIFDHYPAEMRKLYFTPALTDYYNSADGMFTPLTQNLRAPYDNADEGNFFCDHLIIVPEAGHLQICLRYNKSIVSSLEENYGFSGFDIYNEEQFSFRLWRSSTAENPGGEEVGKLVQTRWDEFAMYRYCRLSFEDVDFGMEGDEGAKWIRLEIFIDGLEKDSPFMVAIYENNENYSNFSKYKLTKGELPR